MSTCLLQQKPSVYRKHDTVSLHFDLMSVQSEMRRDAPDDLVLPYTQTMMGFLLFKPKPRRIAIIGLGGGSLPKYCYAKLPAAAILVTEINPDVIALRDVFCIPRDSERFQVRCEDGADFVRNASIPFDVLLVDGFDLNGQSPQLCSQHFYDECYRSLSPGGVMVVNLAVEDSFLARSVARIRRSFEQTVVVDSEDYTNRIAFACKGVALSLPHEQLCARLGRLERQHRVGLRDTLQRIRYEQYKFRSAPVGGADRVDPRAMQERPMASDSSVEILTPPDSLEELGHHGTASSPPPPSQSSNCCPMSNDSIDDDKPRLIELPSPFALDPGTVRLREPAEGFGSEQLARLREGTLGRPYMIDDGRTRSLFFTTASVQSSMRLDDPHALIAPYTRKMMAFLLFRPKPRHVLMIGLGGGSLAKFCYRHLPRTRISVIEISAEVIALREEFAIPRDDQRFEIIQDDGATFLAKASVRPDVILIDAFDEIGVSPSLASADFYQRARQCLTREGLLVMNLSGEKRRYVTHIENLRVAFASAVRLVQVDGDDNVLLFAFRRPQLADLPDFLQHRAVDLEQGLGLEFSRYLKRLRAAHILDAPCNVPI